MTKTRRTTRAEKIVNPGVYEVPVVNWLRKLALLYGAMHPGALEKAILTGLVTTMRN